MDDEYKRNLAKYTNKLSIRAKCVIKGYTDSQSTPINKYLVSKAGLTDEFSRPFDADQWEQIAILISAIYNAPPILEPINLYQFYLPDYKEYTITEELKLEPSLRETSLNPILSTFFQSTTHNDEVLSLMGSFHGEGCCMRKITISNAPILDVSKFSAYEYQDEVMLPPYLIFRQEMPSSKEDITEYSPENVRINSKKVVDMNDPCHINSVILDIDQIKQTPHQDVSLHTNFSEVRPVCMHPGFLSYINIILDEFYTFKHQTKHGKGHICSVIILTAILYSTLKTQDADPEILSIAILTSLFHDSGRQGRDGKDLWEQESAKNARRKIAEKDEKTANIVSNMINAKEIDEIDDVYKSAFFAYKGADSIDIVRVVSVYSPEKNVASGQNEITDIFIRHLPFEFSDFTSIIALIENYTEGENLDSYLEDYFYTEEDEIEVKDGSIVYEYAGFFSRPNINFSNDDIQRISVETNKSVRKVRKDIIEEKNDVITNFYSTLKNGAKYFITKKYLKVDGRYFDDFLEILLFYLPYMPYTMVGMSNYIFPFTHRNLY
jgi:hypothetical protein